MTGRNPPPDAPIVIGLVSDTHGQVRSQIAGVLAGVRMILHAGDVGGPAVLAALKKIAPVEAVYGNVDDPHDPSLARERTVTVNGVTIHVSHGHELGRLTAELALARYPADVVVFGHTHKACVVRASDGRIGVNPGAAGPRRFDLQPSVARLMLAGGAAEVEIISLA
ncbi:MAG: metallophosphoesterase family protein [Thermoanaerobaculia bacterium]